MKSGSTNKMPSDPLAEAFECSEDALAKLPPQQLERVALSFEKLAGIIQFMAETMYDMPRATLSGMPSNEDRAVFILKPNGQDPKQLYPSDSLGLMNFIYDLKKARQMLDDLDEEEDINLSHGSKEENIAISTDVASAIKVLTLMCMNKPDGQVALDQIETLNDMYIVTHTPEIKFILN